MAVKSKKHKKFDLDGLDTSNIPDMDSLLRTRHSVPPKKRDTVPAKPSPEKKLPPRKVKKGSKISGRTIVIDGSNIARLDADDLRYSSLRNVLALVVALARAGARPVCVFDNNERHLLAANPNEPRAAKTLLYLIQHLPAQFKQAPPATDADIMILRIADQHDALIISNDRYTSAGDSHSQRHSWLNSSHTRIARAELTHIAIRCPELNLTARLNHSLEHLVDQCFEMLET
jgi:hypothetical protein